MNHAEACSSCGQFWLDLQAVQELTLNLKNTEATSSNFRDGLWQRINSGEGTPSAVFDEQVPLWNKVRYALTGAAAAAALLIGTTFLTKEQGETNNAFRSAVSVSNLDQNSRSIEQSQSRPANLVSNGPSLRGARLQGDGRQGSTLQGSTLQGTMLQGTMLQGTMQPRRAVQPSLMQSAKQLDMEVLAVEAVRQLEERFATASLGIRMMDKGESNRDLAIAQILESAQEMRGFGEVLVDLREHETLYFIDASIDAELDYAVKMLTRASEDQMPGAQTVESFVAPVLKSGGLANVSRAITLKPTNQRQQQQVIFRVNSMRPEVFSKLFVILGKPEQRHPSAAFILDGECDIFWVAPRSEIQRNSLRIEIDLDNERR